MMKYSILFLMILISCITYGQKVLKGMITDEQNKPIPSASVFLSNTSIGTTADAKGNFELTIPHGKYDLIVSSIGYETHNKTIISSDIPDFITIILKPKAQELETVVIEPFEKDGWEKWGTYFLEAFIGTSKYAQDCKLKNTNAIRFRNSRKNNELTAIALEPLIIENKALGYRLKYQLETFSYNFRSHYLYFEGYPLFEPMEGGNAKQRRWEKNRRDVYYGSLMHFMRCVFRNRLLQEGFEVRSLQRVPNTEKQRIKELYSKGFKKVAADGTIKITHRVENEDTLTYYDRVLAQEDFLNIIGKNLLPGDSIAYAVDNTTAGMDFRDYLLIIYKHGEAAPEYKQQYPKSSTAMMSQITLINSTPIEIQANGSYYKPTDLMSSGYWAWSEKIATMLPFDYKDPSIIDRKSPIIN